MEVKHVQHLASHMTFAWPYFPWILVLLSLSGAFSQITAPGFDVPPPDLTGQEQEVSNVNDSLTSQGDQLTTVHLLFNTTDIGELLGNQSAATFLSPDDTAWSNLATQDRGAELSDMLQAADGKLVLENLLRFHIITDYYLYNQFQLTASGTSFPTLLNLSIYVAPYNGQNVFYVNSSNPDENSTNDRPDLNQDGVISIQGITAVLIPPSLKVLTSGAEESLGIAPAPGPVGPVTIVPLNGSTPPGIDPFGALLNSGPVVRNNLWLVLLATSVSMLLALGPTCRQRRQC